MLTLAAAKLAVLPWFMRGICLILLGSMPGFFALAYWVLPVYRQGESFAAQAAELAAQLESEAPLDDRPVVKVARPSRDDESSQHALRRYPVWHSDQVWLRDLVDLAKHQGVSTQVLKHTGMSRKEDRLVASAVKSAWIENDIPGHLGQRGYEWRMTGSQVDVGRLLAGLASRALWIDALEIWPTAADGTRRLKSKTHVNLPNTRAGAKTTAAQDVLVHAVLTFRQSAWIFQENKPLAAERLPAYRFEQPYESPVVLPSFDTLFSTTNPSCVEATRQAAPLIESQQVFADQALEQIRLVGVIEKTKGGGHRVRRGIFRGPSGALVVAAHNAEVSANGLRVVNLSKSHGVLYSEELGPTVMMLEPTLMSRVSYDRAPVSAPSYHE
jgi:hypothetical protein